MKGEVAVAILASEGLAQVAVSTPEDLPCLSSCLIAFFPSLWFSPMLVLGCLLLVGACMLSHSEAHNAHNSTATFPVITSPHSFQRHRYIKRV